MKTFNVINMLFIIIAANASAADKTWSVIVDTGQDKCYDNTKEISFPKSSQPFFGQDAEFTGNTPVFKDNQDGTISDLNTGLMWSKAVENQKSSLEDAEKAAKQMTLGGYKDWRVPNIKELYSLIDFRGYTGFGDTPHGSEIPTNAIPFINTDYFDFRYGNIADGERYIDAQWLSSTKYVSATMNGDTTLFGVNFADGRIKGYGYSNPRRQSREKKFYVRYVRGQEYGKNDFVDNGDGTITDRTTGLQWMKKDSGKGMNWQDAIQYANKLNYARHNDWRLPNIKELQYIVDYSRSPDTTASAAINSIFQTTVIDNEAGKKDFPYFWSSTTHLDGPEPGSNAAYIAFGRALGKMKGNILDVHGAGAQRSDPKTGEAASHGPQGDLLRIENFVRCVRGGNAKLSLSQPKPDKSKYPYKLRILPTEKTGSGDWELPKNEQVEKENTRPSLKDHIKRLDKDGDGKISKSEFDGPKRFFDRLDKNQDGLLSEDEMPQGPPPGGRQMQR